MANLSVSRGAALVLVGVVLFLGFAIGFLVGYFNKWAKNNAGPVLSGVPNKIIQDGEEDIMGKLFAEMDPENIRTYLRELTEHPHMAGTPADYEQADMLRKFWQKHGLDHTAITPYKVLLSYPADDRPSTVTLYGASGEVIHQAQISEEPLTAEHNQSGVVPPFNAYSGSGTPKGQLVYINYARVEDFKYIVNEKGASFLNGKICIARYGKIFRGSKAQLAEKYGCMGLILYSDPADYAVEGDDSVYPNSWYLPPSGVQRGSLYIDGDAQTQGFPSIESAYRTPITELPLPMIPVHPIGYGDAMKFMRQMEGEEVLNSWKGSLPITYRLGPGFKSPASEIEMDITNLKEARKTYNVFGLIRGSVEPDRYVLLGNHRDAWVFGAVDPSSGTAVMMELSRAMGKLVQQGWRPRRSIVFCSWGAEEHGLIGSREWVEHFGNILTGRAVAYLNVDLAINGNFTFLGRGMPMLYDTMYEVGKRVPNPDPKEVKRGHKTVYDTWQERYPKSGPDGKPVGKPYIPTLGSGSDFAPFVAKIGMSCADVRYYMDRSLRLSSYPLYHSAYETFHLVNDIMDPTFKFSLATAQYWGELARSLADSLILPMDVTAYPTEIQGYLSRLEEKYGDVISREGFTAEMNFITKALSKFEKSASDFQDRLSQVNKNNPLEVRMVNDQFMQVERAFIQPQGLPGRPHTRHIIYAPSVHNSYAGSTFPGLVDTLYELEELDTEYKKIEKRTEIRKHMSVIAFHLETAASALEDALNFMSVNTV